LNNSPINENPSFEINSFDQKEDILYVILPYFNFAKSISRKNLLLEFVDRYKNFSAQMRIVIIEASLEEFVFPNEMDGVFNILKYRINSYLWVKENLINVAISKLPSDWMYVSWLDTDITFSNENWVKDAIDELKKSDFIQLFHQVVDVGPNGETNSVLNGFGYMHKNSQKEWKNVRRSNSLYWHPRHAWGCTKTAYVKIGGLFEYAILGSGDLLMAVSLIGKVDDYLEHP
jgi:hypothetical protein